MYVCVISRSSSSWLQLCQIIIIAHHHWLHCTLQCAVSSSNKTVFHLPQIHTYYRISTWYVYKNTPLSLTMRECKLRCDIHFARNICYRVISVLLTSLELYAVRVCVLWVGAKRDVCARTQNHTHTNAFVIRMNAICKQRMFAFIFDIWFLERFLFFLQNNCFLGNGFLFLSTFFSWSTQNAFPIFGVN